MTYKIQVKIAGAEFTAEGPQEAVEEHYKLFLDALKVATPPARNIIPEAEANTSKNKLDRQELAKADLVKVFVDENDQLSLKYRPNTENRDADGLLALLYGYKKLKNVDEVLSVRLTTSAAQSGLSGHKASLVFDSSYDKYVRTGGNRRGSFYSLNNAGIQKAEEIIAKILES